MVQIASDRCIWREGVVPKKRCNPHQCLILVFHSSDMPPNVPPSRQRCPVFLIPQTRRLGSLHRPVAQHLFAPGGNVMGAPLSITRLCARRVTSGLERKGSGLFHPPAPLHLSQLADTSPKQSGQQLAGSGSGRFWPRGIDCSHSQNGLARVGLRSPTPGGQHFAAAPIHRNKLSRIRYPPLP